MRLKTRLVTSVCLLAIAQAAGTAQAQDDAADKEELEQIVVKGIRASVGRALDTKRDATGFLDAVNATDVGKLPDKNIAETLQRIPGVAIQRSRGEGDFVSIRGLGPDFVRGTINGRSLVSATESIDPILSGNTITTTGRAANFDVLPSELIGSLEVYKTPSAKHVEGGIGGVVNVVTARPLDLGTQYAASAEGTYRGFAGEVDPSASALVSWANEDRTFGALLSAAYSDRSIRQDLSRHFGWFQSFGISQQLDTNNDGVGDADPGVTLFPLSNNQEVTLENRERFTFSGTLQWSPDDTTEIVFDALYSQRDVDSQTTNFIFLPIIFDQDLIDLGLQNADGSFRVGDFVDGGTFFRMPSSLRPELTTDNQAGEDDLLSFGFNGSKRLGDWLLALDLSYSDASGGTTFDRVRIDGNNGMFSFLTDIDDDGFTIQENPGSGDLGDPSNFVLSVLDDRITTNDDKEFAAQFDTTRDIDSNFLSAVEFGARFRTRTKDVNRATNGNGIGVTGEDITVADVGTFINGQDNFLDGNTRQSFDYASLVFPDNDAARAALLAAGITSPTPDDPFGISSINEKVYAAYVQLNLDGEIGGVPFVGDVGARLVHTSQTIDGFDAQFVITDNGGTDTTVFDDLSTGSATPVTFEDNYTNILPSFNLRFELARNLFLRLAASKSLTRPTFNDLAPSFSINANASNDVNQDGFAVQLNAGNPALLPFEAANYDVGLEWYFAESSVLAVNVFHKNLENFIAGVTEGPSTQLAGAPIRAIGELMGGGAIDPLPIDQVTQPDNQGEASIIGVEINYQHALPYGFGVLANLTLTDTSAEFIATGETIDFPGVSDLTFNITGYYENGPVEARLAYSYRDDFLLIPSAIGGLPQQIFVDSYAQLDASVSYAITENIQIFVTALNLTDSEEDLFTEVSAGIGRRYYSKSIVGRRFGFGARAAF